MKLKRYQSGFTLIELLVIISIIGFLVAAVMLYLSQSRQKSRDAKRVADVKQISSALDLFNSHCGSYPIEASVIPLDATQRLFTGSAAGCGDKSGTGTNGGIGATASGTTIVQQFVAAPLPADSATCATGSNNSYNYSSTTGTTYTLTFCLGQATGGYPAGMNTITR